MRLVLMAALIALPAVASAQQPADDSYQAEPPQRIRSILVKPGEDCPKAEGNEVVVCAPIESPYRVPRALRDEGPVKPQNQAWGARALVLDEESRRASGIPNTCSPIGTGGQTGCTLQLIQQWQAERAAKARGQ
ncbi:MAG: hypothetical protein A4S16_06035 [Proteobacteria bacterium SG_bin6]|nr:MAG: hypothetical protein A4S16_06035 [Proteobacteria bacterium SG_bin6]